jgi:uncharacterized protein (DUF58 family)
MARRGKPALDPHATIVRKKPSLDFSVTGLVYISMMLFMGLAAINSQANLLFGVFGLMIGILLVSGVVSKRVLKGLTLTRSLPEHGTVGQPITVNYEFTNNKRFWPSLSVTVAEIDGAEAFVKQPHGYLLHAAPKQTVNVPVELMPKRRGLHTLDRHQISTSFPFGFIKRAIDRRQEDHLLIFPATGHVDPKIMSLMRSAESSGPTMRPRRGGMDEFYGLKEFRSGENPRYIYWRRSARTGTLVSKEMTHVSPPRLMLLVDTYFDVPIHLPEPPMSRGGRHAPATPVASNAGDVARARATVEKVIAMAGSMVNFAIEQGLPVGLAAWSDGLVAITANRGKRHRRDLLTLLAQLPENATFDTRQLLDGSYELQESNTTAVLISPRDIQLGLGESARGGIVVVAATGPQAERYFTFPPNVDFAHSMPMSERGKGQAARGKGETKPLEPQASSSSSPRPTPLTPHP